MDVGEESERASYKIFTGIFKKAYSKAILRDIRRSKKSFLVDARDCGTERNMYGKQKEKSTKIGTTAAFLMLTSKRKKCKEVPQKAQ